MKYYVFMENYGHTLCVKVNDYNEKIKELLEWARQPYDVSVVVKNPESIELNNELMLDTKEYFLGEINVNRVSFCWDESEDEIEENIKLIESILID